MIGVLGVLIGLAQVLDSNDMRGRFTGAAFALYFTVVAGIHVYKGRRGEDVGPFRPPNPWLIAVLSAGSLSVLVAGVITSYAPAVIGGAICLLTSLAGLLVTD